MKNYLVKINIQAGEYVKRSFSLVTSESYEEACKLALLGQCHSDIGEGAEWTDSGIADLGWEFHYSVSSCTELTDEHAEVLKRYL